MNTSAPAIGVFDESFTAPFSVSADIAAGIMTASTNNRRLRIRMTPGPILAKVAWRHKTRSELLGGPIGTIRRKVTPLLSYCAKTVSEPDPFHPMNLFFERKQQIG